MLLGAAGLPVTWWLAEAWLPPGRGLALSATLCGAWVWLVTLLGLGLLWFARRLPPAQQVNARLGHVVFRLLLCAGGLILYLLTLAPADRGGVGLFGLGWYALTWLIDLALLWEGRPTEPGQGGGSASTADLLGPEDGHIRQARDTQAGR